VAIERIDTDRCVGCGNCVDACIMDVIRMDPETGKAYAKYPRDCYCCYCCETECPAGAIYVTPQRLIPIPPAWS
jgi:NAD-dependent dihydropyrimidine dehydrogenase PreA subunit